MILMGVIIAYNVIFMESVRKIKKIISHEHLHDRV
jgi:hypothetical protein